MDLQPGILGRYPTTEEYLARVNRGIAAARKSGIRVIYVTVSFRAGRPEVSQRNKMFTSIAANTSFVTGDPSTEVHPAVAPAPGEVHVIKRRVSAFAGSDLDVVLRAGNIDTLVLCGVATSGVVLSTLRQAADLDYRLSVLSDGCLDQDAEVHRVLTEKVFVRQADVLTIDQWVGGLET
ncbi:MAG TPA: isochorismatase family cysteine hydrolase [Gemmatimonadales bacterium]|jgi:nicotinamidase-related amidase|nr:isochorismatase family cysteine hydrolase [Gemmatimonadales bacterium]